ncbi:hypothetical protein NEDG_01937 [Nematocida displodere]|uniref:Uncharacterized protein n=1 Tax=Nematocida displodere TaxID=1805483 RepID=A0A177EJ34_9MICR|nr:hypothetical protein NEDG_01937 [Nematocida displodere]
MIDIKTLLIQIQTCYTTAPPVLFKNPKRSFLLLERMLRLHSYHKKGFTYSAVIKMMSSRKRASKEEIQHWLTMLVRLNVLLCTEQTSKRKTILYFTFTPQALSTRNEVLIASLFQ